MTKLAVKVAVIESERGWGSKIDDWMICLTNEDAQNFQKEFNSANNKDVFPDWYMYCDGTVEPIDLTDSQYNEIIKSDNSRMWLSSAKRIK